MFVDAGSLSQWMGSQFENALDEDPQSGASPVQVVNLDPMGFLSILKRSNMWGHAKMVREQELI